MRCIQPRLSKGKYSNERENKSKEIVKGCQMIFSEGCECRCSFTLISRHWSRANKPSSHDPLPFYGNAPLHPINLLFKPRYSCFSSIIESFNCVSIPRARIPKHVPRILPPANSRDGVPRWSRRLAMRRHFDILHHGCTESLLHRVTSNTRCKTRRLRPLLCQESSRRKVLHS
jgi:hypothetical protein